jgi:hypothetical protein
MTIQAITNGMIFCTNSIVSAIASAAGGSVDDGKSDAFSKSMDILREMLVPGLEKAEDNKMKRVREILEREREQPLELRPMARPSKKKASQKRR